METEKDRLKASVEAQYMKERYEELNQYIEKLNKQLRDYFAKLRNCFFLEIIALMVWVGISLTLGDGWIELTAYLVWFLLLVRHWVYLHPKIIGTLAELEGCFETLRILNIISKNDNNRKKRKMKLLKDNPIERLWAQIKRKKQEEVYGGAS